jgi:REP element-mobilizing transposase RayT
VEDYVYCFFELEPKVSVSDVMKNAKAKSSKWVNENELLKHRFEWQKGVGPFFYSRSHIDRVFKYIKNQEAHHKKETFREEYIKMLKAFNVEYDEKYIFEDLI